MSKRYKDNYWKDVPEDLRLMCLAEMRGSGHYCAESVLQLLLDRMDYCDSYSTGVTPYNVLKWIDVGFEACLFPLTSHGNDWTFHGTQIEKILTRANELLIKVAPKDYAEGHKMSKKYMRQFRVAEFAQRLNVYFCVLYAYTNKWAKYRDRLQKVLADTERNAEYMVSSGEGISFITPADWEGYFYIGTDTWEPLSFLGKELFIDGNAGKMFIQVYEEYVFFLNSLKDKKPDSGYVETICYNAETGLKYLCSQLLDNYTISVRDGSSLNSGYLLEKEIFEEIIRESEKRCPPETNPDDFLPFM